MAACTVQIPQRFIVLYSMNPLAAGVRLLPFALMTPVGSVCSAILLDKKLVTPNALLLIGGALQTIGVALFATLTTSRETLPQQYGFQILIGTGIGFVSTATFLLVPIKMEKRDLGMFPCFLICRLRSLLSGKRSDIFIAVGTGTVAQFRILGGVVALAVVTCISTPHIRDALLEAIPPEQTHAILERLEMIPSLPEDTQAHVRDSFHRGFDLQMTILIGFAAAHIPAGLVMLSKESLPEALRPSMDNDVVAGSGRM